MSVLIVTSLGDIVVDLYADKCPLTCKNFLKLCKIKYYNGCLFHTVQKDFTAQTGDPTGTGAGGDSVYKFLYGDQARFFGDEIHLDLKHSKMGTVAMASAGENLNASQFYFTLRDDLDYLDGKHTVFGEIAEGLETLTRINEAYVDEKNRPFKNIRIKHAYILDDPFDDPSQLAELIPEASPEGKPKDEVDGDVRLEDDWVPMDEQLGTAELEEVLRAKEAHSSAVVLESIGDIPEAETKPPDNVLFVCKLNPVTEDEDLHTIFSRFGTVISADIIRDYKTGDSLCYAFIEFETKEACELAYFKMDNALIDDRRIHVDFSQSVAKLWSQYRRKDNQPAGRGCFKCGALDHMAKDCTGDPANKHQPSKYILKDDNMQRGGDNNSRYEMVFDGDTPESPRQGKRHGHRDPDYQIDREKKDGKERYRQSDRDRGHRQDTPDYQIDREKKEGKERYRQSDRDRGHRQDTRYPESKGGSRYPEERLDKEKYMDRRKDRDDRDYRKRSSDSQRDYDSHKDHRDYRKRTSDSHRDHDGHKGNRDEREHRRRSAENDDDPEYDRDRRNRDDKRSRALR
ncbi:peptidyl-prolyl cis-trans isomerase CYP59-like isoform X3 [Populus nigra]|uniref:peptidyl-prolyl cis-trans isomerase CYP59-like isoform X3 n=1 Tax=Populus nigra TaxID=3691 RepID=UPI002B268361|nr:peptidyl-prolyl cis-trans isomerase CYP59-like isoform X3 [Populus nigra]